ncbi:beta-defensin 134 [Carlito syrichta]|uniref:Beta-defensin 134 n=1 Tax=Carlito syrichta TaxID=1868482 RepID=A0A3Q0DGL5_CARSF|nr:beta-defensin 134 [Carlito syrichta]
MKPILIVLVFLFLGEPALSGFSLFSSEIHKKCHKNGICRLQCYGSEMLVAYCMFQLECCVKGNPP